METAATNEFVRQNTFTHIYLEESPDTFPIIWYTMQLERELSE